MSRLEDHQRLRAKAVTLYYEANATQQEIAARLRISRPKAQRLLQEARDAGVVQIRILPDPGLHPSIEYELEQRFSLDEAIVVETPPGGSVRQSLGRAAARHLVAILDPGTTIGLSWGRTLLAMVNALDPIRTRDVRVVQILGALGEPSSEDHATELARRAAQSLGAALYLVPAPGVVADAAIRRALLADGSVSQSLDLARHSDVVFVGIGATLPDSVVMRGGAVLSADDVAELESHGAVGDIALRFFDADGKPVDSSVDSRVVGLDLDDLRRMHVVGVAGGAHKLGAIRASLRGGLLKLLITDLVTARSLLADEGDR